MRVPAGTRSLLLPLPRGAPPKWRHIPSTSFWTVVPSPDFVLPRRVCALHSAAPGCCIQPTNQPANQLTYQPTNQQRRTSSGMKWTCVTVRASRVFSRRRAPFSKQSCMKNKSRSSAANSASPRLMAPAGSPWNFRIPLRNCRKIREVGVEKFSARVIPEEVWETCHRALELRAADERKRASKSRPREIALAVDLCLRWDFLWRS